MKHPIYRVSNFKIVGPYTLRVAFDDNGEQVINFETVLAGELFAPLRDLTVLIKLGRLQCRASKMRLKGVSVARRN